MVRSFEDHLYGEDPKNTAIPYPGISVCEGDLHCIYRIAGCKGTIQAYLSSGDADHRLCYHAILCDVDIQIARI